MSALEIGQSLFLEEKHLEEIGICTLIATLINVNIDSKKSKLASPEDFYRFKKEEKFKISAASADSFFSLAKSGKIPSWAIAIAPLNELVSARTHKEPSGIRALSGSGFFALSPIFQGGELFSPLIIIDRAESTIILQDLDSDRSCTILNPEFKGESIGYAIDKYFQII